MLRRLAETGSRGSRRIPAAAFQTRPRELHASTIMAKQVSAADIANSYKQDLISTSSNLAKKIGRKATLAGILANADGPSRKYAESTAKSCRDVGIDFRFIELGQNSEENVQPSDVEQAILECNIDSSIDGIMVYFPIFSSEEDNYIQQVVSPGKDVEGLHFVWRFNLYHNLRWIKPATLFSGQMAALSLTDNNEESSISERDGLVKAILPCTPLAVVKSLEYLQAYNPLLEYGQRAFGKTVTIINRSEVVGRPLAALLANDGAKVFSVDVNNTVEYSRRKYENTESKGSKAPAWQPRHTTRTSNLSLEECLGQSDIVISGVPTDSYKINTQHLKDGLIAVNFSSHKNFEADIKEKASLYLPSIGKITIAMLQRNLLRLADYHQQL